jgi:hypothetical protein
MPRLADMREDLEKRSDPAILSCRAHTPYSGCWWEPNYWLLHKKLVYPLYVTGGAYSICAVGSLADVLMRGCVIEAFIERLGDDDDYDRWEIEEIGEIEPNPNNLNTLTAILANHGLQGPIWTCSTCGRSFRGIARFLGYTGNGGVGIWLQEPCCEECFRALRWCETCTQVVLPVDGRCAGIDEDESESHVLHAFVAGEDDQAEVFHMTGHHYLLEGVDRPDCILAEEE